VQAKIAALGQRLKAKRYRATLVRRGSMPKEHGTERPCGMPALEDQRVQLACAQLFTASYAQDCVDCSDGDRPGRGAFDAVRALPFDRPYGR
jgi:retron-type reverse transcriptase